MGIYEDLGVTPIINLWGTATRLGGSLMAPEVIEAMVHASRQSVKMDDLQAAASRIISEITGAEAGYVTCGASSGLTLGTAACMTGLDIAKMDRLPDATDMPNEVVMPRDQRCGYDHAIRAAGAKIVEVGYNEQNTGSLRPVEIWEFEAALTERTAAIALILYVYSDRTGNQLKEVAHMARRHHVPVIVDAAGSVPPLENLRRFIRLGADLVTFSGGKALRGPQNTGILCGRHDLIAAAALQHLDLGGFSHMWHPPESLIPKAKLIGQPRQGIGRGQKVSKEALVGLLIRLRQLTKEKTLDEAKQMQQMLMRIIRAIEDIPSVQAELLHPASEGSGSVPTLRVKLDAERLGRDAFEISLELRNGRPGLWVNEKNLSDNIMLITAVNLNEQLADTVGQRLREVFTGEN